MARDDNNNYGLIPKQEHQEPTVFPKIILDTSLSSDAAENASSRTIVSNYFGLDMLAKFIYSRNSFDDIATLTVIQRWYNSDGLHEAINTYNLSISELKKDERNRRVLNALGQDYGEILDKTILNLSLKNISRLGSVKMLLDIKNIDGYDEVLYCKRIQKSLTKDNMDAIQAGMIDEYDTAVTHTLHMNILWKIFKCCCCPYF